MTKYTDVIRNIARTILYGFATGIQTREDERQKEFTVESADTQVEMGTRRVTTEMCPYRLGGMECGLTLTYENVLITAQDSSANTLTLQKLSGNWTYSADTRYVAGFLQFLSGPLNGSSTDIANVTAFGTNTMTIKLGDTPNLTVVPGTIAHITFGCAKTMSACQTNNNFNRYGGFPFVPGARSFTAGSQLVDI